MKKSGEEANPRSYPEKASYGVPAYFAGMPFAELKSKQAVYTLGLLHAELAGKLLANKREAIRK